MFGYFRFNQEYATWNMKRAYKNYYCGTCYALEYHYGQFTRFLLSYEVVLLALIAGLYNNVQHDPLSCFGKEPEKIQFKNAYWEKIAAINVLFFSAELSDDINDENSFAAKLGYSVFKKAIKKAEEEHKSIAEIINTGYKEMLELERANSDIISICNCFSKFMSQMIVTAFDVNDTMAEYVEAVSGWLYFIDQLDDYDDDLSKGKYNPLVIPGTSKVEFINYHHQELCQYINIIEKNFSKIKLKMDRSTCEGNILFSVLNETIPAVTFRILCNQELPKLLHRNKSNVEWSK